MKIVIKIPKEFEEHFNSDRFEDSLQRVRFDIHKSIIGNKNVLSRKNEIEILDMLTEAFLNGTPLPKGHGRLKDIDKFPVNEIEKMEYNYECGENECHSEEIVYLDDIINAETIIEADKE